jgi:hypothetical protein
LCTPHRVRLGVSYESSESVNCDQRSRYVLKNELSGRRERRGAFVSSSPLEAEIRSRY